MRVKIILCCGCVLSRCSVRSVRALWMALGGFSSKCCFLSDAGNSLFLFPRITRTLACHGAANAKQSTCPGLNIAYCIQHSASYFLWDHQIGAVLCSEGRALFPACLWYFFKTAALWSGSEVWNHRSCLRRAGLGSLTEVHDTFAMGLQPLCVHTENFLF